MFSRSSFTILCHTERNQMRYEVCEGSFQGEPCRFLMVNGYMQSAYFLNEEWKDHLVFPYMRLFGYAFALYPDLKDVLLLGGGAFSYPSFFMKNYPEKTMDVIEPDEVILSLGNDYFKTGLLLKSFPDRLRVITDPSLNRLEKTYDVIINDAFDGKKGMKRHLEDLELTRSLLKKDGIFIVNMAASMRGIHSLERRRLTRLLKKMFQHVICMPCEDEADLYHPQNILIFAADVPLERE